MTTKLTVSLKLLALALALSAAGCVKVRAPVEPREDPANWPQIMLADRELQGRIAIRRPIVEQDQAGLLFVTVPLTSWRTEAPWSMAPSSTPGRSGSKCSPKLFHGGNALAHVIVE